MSVKENYIISQDNVDSLIQSSIEYTDNQQLDKAIAALDKARNLLSTEKSVDYAKIVFYKGYAYDINGHLDTALIIYEDSKNIYESLDEKMEVARCMNYIASAHYFKGDYESAIENYIACFNYSDDNDISDIKLQALINLGVMYRVTDKNLDAIKVYRRTLELASQAEDLDLKSATYHNLGVAYTFEDSFELAFVYLDSAFVINESFGDSLKLSRTANAIGDAYHMQGENLDKAKEYFLLSEDLQVYKSSQDILPKTYLALGQIEDELNNFAASDRYYKKGLAIIEETERGDILMNYYKSYQSLLAKQRKYEESYAYQNKYIDLYEELRSIEKQKDIEELQTKYETNQKENELQLLAARNQIQETRFKLLGYGSIILAAFLSILFLLNRQLKKKNEIVSQALKDKDTMLREVHHRIKNNLQLVSGLLNLQSDHVQEEKSVQALKDSEIRVQSIAILHQDLYINDNLRDVDSEVYLGRLIENLSNSFDINSKNIHIESDIQPLLLDVDSMIPIGLIVNELITNSVKHAFNDRNGGTIDVRLKEQGEKLLLSVSDNGNVTTEKDVANHSFGYNLIQNFALRLAATIETSYDDGLKVELQIENFKKAALV